MMRYFSLLTSVFLVAHFAVSVIAFLPRVNLGTRELTTRDHAMITKEGFLRPLIYFFADNPQYLKNDSLTDILYHIHNVQDAVQKTINNISPQIKFLNALNEIQSANVEIDSFPFSTSAAAHFDGEQFKQGVTRLVQLRQELITSLLQGDKLQHSRNLAGAALHTLQDFYSHSNWIELGNPGPYEILAKPGNEIPQEYIADPTEATCRSCKPGACEKNLITTKLTSGYRSGQDIRKPEKMGKCSHGGKLDESRLKPAIGGINKDSTSTVESPHASLHKIAADLAIEATSIFLNDIRSAVGDDIFAKFLNLQSEKSMALVIDVSGSMSDEINEVKKVSIAFIQGTLQQKRASFTYILVPFSDPDVGPVTVTNDPKTVIDAVNKLTAAGGGDCPELGMTGIYQALLHCPPETIVYYFSDADVKDEWRGNEIMSLAKDKKVKIIFILSGKCGRRKKRDRQQSGQSTNLKEFHRTRRSVQGKALYQAIADQTGGQILETNKAGVADVIKVIDRGTSGNSPVDFRKVELLNMKESRAEFFSGHAFFVDVDSTLERLVFVLTAASSPSLEIKTVGGNSFLQIKVITSSNKLLIKEATELVSGTLKLKVSCNGPYTLQVTGSSPLDFTYQLLDIEDLERGTTRRVVGNPLRGQPLLLTIDFVGEGLEKASNVTLVGVNGRDLDTFTLMQGSYKTSYFVTFVPSAEKFRLKLSGTDKAGAHFQRAKPTLFTLGDVKLFKNVNSRNSSNTIFPGKTTELEINVRNSGEMQNLYFTASDDLEYFKTIKPSQGTLGKNDTLVLRLTLLAPSDAKYGVTSTVTLFASQNSDFTQVVNFMVLFVTVAAKNPDLAPPICTVVSQTGTCAEVYGRPECKSNTWRARVMFSDAGEGLSLITTRYNLNGAHKVDRFIKGVVNKSIQASFSSNCCHPRVLFVGLDLVGNMGTCSISLVPDIVSLRAKHSNAAVSLYPGNTTKVPFTLINLGSKGSFSFEVTKTPALISYVLPFSLVLETNASAVCEVVLKSRGDPEGNEVQNLTVQAVSQLNSVNVRRVALFFIQVSELPRKETRPTTPAFSRFHLEAVLSNDHFSLTPGEWLKVNFTKKNLVLDNTFTVHNPDLAPPICTMVKQTGTCTEVYGRPECKSNAWHARVMFSDAGKGLSLITTQDNRNGTLKVDRFIKGVVNKSIQASFSSNCCHPRVLFIGLDLVGNMGTCSISLVPDILSLRAKHSTAVVSLYPGNITKVPFTLINLGSKGSFSLEVTRAPELISYVLPFSLVLETNASAVCEVVLKSRGDPEGNEVQNLTVQAVSQFNSVNLRRVALFFIQVSELPRKETRPTTPAFSSLHLEAILTSDHFSLTPGEWLKVNFTIKNLALDNTFTFHVHSNQSSLNGSVQPSSVFLKTMQSTSCALILTSQLDAIANTVTQVNVTATHASRNTDVKQSQVFSITVTIQRRPSAETKDFDHGNRRLDKLYVALIAVGVVFILLLPLVFFAYRKKYGSMRPESSAKVIYI